MNMPIKYGTLNVIPPLRTYGEQRQDERTRVTKSKLSKNISIQCIRITTIQYLDLRSKMPCFKASYIAYINQVSKKYKYKQLWTLVLNYIRNSIKI